MAEQTEGQPSGNQADAFGNISAPQDGEPELLSDEALGLDDAPSDEVPEAPQQEVTDPAATEPETTPQPQEPEAEAPAPQPEAEAPAGDPPKKWAGKYEAPEQLEAGYAHQSRYIRDLQQELALLRQQVQARQEQPIQSAAEQSEFDPLDPESAQRFIQEQIQKGVEQTRQQEFASSVESEFAAFTVRHPDVAQNPLLDEQVAQAIIDAQQVYDPQGNPVFDPQGNPVLDVSRFPINAQNLDSVYEVANALVSDPNVAKMMDDLDLKRTKENVDLAREAVQHPAFGEILLAVPTSMESDRGLEWARKQAQLPAQFQQARETVIQPTKEDLHKKTFVETGGGGAPIEAAPGDVNDEILAAGANSGRSVFG